jgi:predicted O-methyltransferase YrrM
MMLGKLKTAMKLAMSRTPAGRFVMHRYTYNFTPRQLCFLTACVDRTAALSGGIAEVGTFLGHTAVFLNAHMTAEGIEKPYFAIDTFSGFVPSHLAHERTARDKAPFFANMRGAFADNSKTLFDRQLTLNGIMRVRSIEADAALFDYATLAPFSFVIIDVDLYIPVLRALEKVTPLMQRGGIIVVDDCRPGQIFDGALQAYTEFVTANGYPSKVVHTKLGIIEI